MQNGTNARASEIEIFVAVNGPGASDQPHCIRAIVDLEKKRPPKESMWSKLGLSNHKPKSSSILQTAAFTAARGAVSVADACSDLERSHFV